MQPASRSRVLVTMRSVVVALLLCAGTAAADPAPDTKMSDKDCAQARKEGRTCMLTIEGLDLPGERPVSTEATINIIKFLHDHSLVKVRKDFIPEILRTAEDL